MPTPTLYYDYDESDMRRDVTCVPYKWEKGAQVTRTSAVDQKEGWNFGKYRYEWTAEVRLVTGDDGLNQIYVRYADVYLMLAEVLNELGDKDGAKNYMRPIRERAFPESDRKIKVDDYLEALTTKEQVFKAIVDERKFEFAGEMLRKQDLIRWNMLGEKVQDTKRKMTALRNYEGDYAALPRTLYYRLKSDKETLEFYGFNKGENVVPEGDDWATVNWQQAAISDLRLQYFIWQIRIRVSIGLSFRAIWILNWVIW